MSAAQKSADLELVACDIFKPSGSDLTLMKSTSFEEKMSKQKHNWEAIFPVICCSVFTGCGDDKEIVFKNFHEFSKQ